MKNTIVLWGAFLVLFICNTNADPPKPEEMKGFDECLKESKVSKEDVLSHPPKMSPEMLCFMKCSLEKSGKIDAEGKIVLEELEKDISHIPNLTDKQKEDFTKCIVAAGKIEKCEDVSKTKVCWAALGHHKQ